MLTQTETCQVDLYLDNVQGAVDLTTVDFFEDCCTCPACTGRVA